MLDVVIVGGGPAGLQAALILARARRTVALVDAGHPRNEAARELHGFMTRDGVRPGELLRLARAELAYYPHVTLINGRVSSAEALGGRFVVWHGRAELLRSRKLLLATGIADELPNVPGLRELYGRCVHHCSFCDGYEVRDQSLAVYGKGRRGFEAARLLRNWSSRVALFTDGPSHLGPKHRAELARLGVPVKTGRILALEGHGRGLIVQLVGAVVAFTADALFFNTPSHQRSDLACQLGAAMTRDGAIRVHGHGRTSIPGLYAAGNALRDVMLSIVAAGEGAQAAFGMVGELVREDAARQLA